MKKIFKKSLIILLIISLAVMLNTYVFSATTLTYTPSKTEVAANDMIYISISGVPTNMASMTGKFEYDTNFFEDINGFSAYNTENKEFSYANANTRTSSTATFGTITVKIKSDATGTGTIKFSNVKVFTGDAGDTGTDCDDVTLTFTIPSSTSGETGGNTTGNETGNTTGNETGNTTGNETGNATGNETGNETGNKTGNMAGNTGTNSSTTGEGNNSQITSNSITAGKTDPTTTTKTIPYAGIEKGLIIGIAIVSIMGIFSYIWLKKYKEV